MGGAEVVGFGRDGQEGGLLVDGSFFPGLEEGFGGGGDLGDGLTGEAESGEGFEGADGAVELVEAGEEFLVVEEFGFGSDGHDEEGVTAGVADGPLEVRDALEGAESGDAAVVDLGDGLGGGDADTGAIVAAGAGADDDGGEGLAGGKLA